MKPWLLLALTLGACGDDSSGTGTTPDLSGVAGDLSAFAFCSGTSVAGTCAQTFFASLASCFPTTGSCNRVDLPPPQNQDCWANGSKFVSSFTAPDGGLYTIHGDFSHAGKACYSLNLVEDSDGMLTVTAGDQTLIYGIRSGDVHCPDGTTANIGANFGSCSELKQLMSPDGTVCTVGDCP